MYLCVINYYYYIYTYLQEDDSRDLCEFVNACAEGGAHSV